MQRTESPIIKDLVLVGGGHSHVAVLKAFGMRPMPGARLTLICREAMAPYSGMLPGCIAGHYSSEQAHIDLRPLCHFAGARLYHDEVIGLDLPGQQVLCRHRPPVRFDLLSLNTGSTPRLLDVPGAAEFALPIKPIDRFFQGWDRLIALALSSGQSEFQIVVVGGGAGGVELTLATQYRLQRLLSEKGRTDLRLAFHLVADTPTLLPTHNRRARAKFERILRQRNVQLHLGHRAIQVEQNRVHCQPGQALPFDVLLWATSAAPAPWLSSSGLSTSPQGFISVNECLQSVSHPFVFAAGDVADVLDHPRPKSGVFAVRQGPPLARNLRLALTGQPPVAFRPQKNFLSLISTGDRYAVASRGPWACEGRWVWKLKHWIDRRWMEQYQTMPEQETRTPEPIGGDLASPEMLRELSASSQRCGGCAAKVGSTILSRVLRRLQTVERADVLVGLNAPDDAAVLTIPPGLAAVQTVDLFRSFLDDPYLFGKIAATHALGDIFAMGATPQSALAIAQIPHGLESKMEEDLYQLLAGATEVLRQNNTTLAGGHTAEAAELAFGLAVTGLADPKLLLRKGGIRPGDHLILTKPLGTGLILAADMRGKTRGRWIEEAIASMLVSNREAAPCFLRHHATACTDVTGFGLLGHLAEMVQASEVEVELWLDAVAVLDGVREILAHGIVSSLYAQNLRQQRAVRNAEEAARHALYPALFDPQTAGGLLASLPATEAKDCLFELQRLGYTHASIVGRARPPEPDTPPILVHVGLPPALS